MKKVLMIIAAVVLASATYAQNYNWAVGARISGTTVGVAAKYNMSASNSIEGILSIPYKNGFIVTGLYERNIPVIGNGFHFYYGAGAHVGTWGVLSSFRLGIDAIVGLEYKIANAPIAFSIDYKPSLDIITKAKFHIADFGLGIKYTF